MDFTTMVKMDRFATVFRNGVDHSPDNSADLLDLVKSFLERDDDMERRDKQSREEEKAHNKNEYDSYSCDSDDTANKLRILFGSQESKNEMNAKEAIRVEAERALQLELLGNRSLKGFKRQLMAHLRKKGFDAGLCKSKWEKSRSFPAGDHEYIDVNIDEDRYIVEIFLAREFDIARPTSQYTSLRNIFPEIFVGNLEELKQVVRLMCSAIKESMKSRDMHVPPWRRNGYMQAKWFGSYRRTTNEALVHTASGWQETSPEKGSICFKALPAKAYRCRGDFDINADLKVGNLTATFSRHGLLL